MGPTVAHSLRMRLLLLLILPFLNGRSIVRERNDVIKQALIPTLVNIIGHARMVEHGTGDDVDNLLDFMDEEKILDPFLSWLGWFTDMVVKGDDTSSEETVVRERNDVIKQALIPTLVNIIRHARMAEHGTGIDELPRSLRPPRSPPSPRLPRSQQRRRRQRSPPRRPPPRRSRSSASNLIAHHYSFFYLNP